MKTGWLICNGSHITDIFTNVHELYFDASTNLDIDLIVIKNSEIYTIVENGDMVLKTKEKYPEPDFVLFLDKDIRLGRQMEAMGFRLFNSTEVIRICDDKSTTTQFLANHGIPMPKTIVCPLAFTEEMANDDSYMDMLETELGYPLIVKEGYGSFGEQVYLIKNREELEKTREKLVFTTHIYQEFIDTSLGRDVRLHVVGDEVVATIMRYSDNDFRANASIGGKMKKYDPPQSFKELAIKISKLMNADFLGVDILFGENDTPILCEVNSNAHFKAIHQATGINVAYHILEYILKEI